MRLTNNRRGEAWRTCDRCGFDYPMSRLRRQDGLLVCVDHCIFEQGHQYYMSKLELPSREGVAEDEPQGSEAII